MITRTDPALFMRGLFVLLGLVSLMGMTAMVVWLAIENPGVNALIGNLLSTIVGVQAMLLKDAWGWWFNASKRTIDDDREAR